MVIILQIIIFRENLGFVDYEIKDDIRLEIEGITEYIDIEPSISFKRKKDKLIDQDFIEKVR